MGAQVLEDTPGVVALVGQRHAQHGIVEVGLAQVRQVGLLALSPGRLRRVESVAATRHDPGHLVAEVGGHRRDGRLRVLDGVVQQGRHGDDPGSVVERRVGGGVLDGVAGHHQQVAHVGDRGLLAELPPVGDPGELECLGQALSQYGSRTG